MALYTKIDQKTETKLAWFRITIVVISAGICTGDFLVWLHASS